MPDQSEPTAPDVPAYVVEPLQSRSRTVDELEALADYCRELAEYKQRPLDSTSGEPATETEGSVNKSQGEMEEALEEIDYDELDHEQITESVGGTVQIYYSNCGPGCDGCPHGAYARLAWRGPDGSVKNKHLGKADAFGFSDSEIADASPD